MTEDSNAQCCGVCMVPSRQEMFNRAWNGLKAQAWRQAGYSNEAGAFICQYLTKDGLRCGWGHVDPAHTPGFCGTVRELRQTGVGLASKLSLEDFEFAKDVQRAHDYSVDADDMKLRMHSVAAKYKLSIPS